MSVGVFFLADVFILVLFPWFGSAEGFVIDLIVSFVLFSIGAGLIRKYDSDKKKSKESEIDKDEKIKDLEERLDKIEDEKTKSDDKSENS